MYVLIQFISIQGNQTFLWRINNYVMILFNFFLIVLLAAGTYERTYIDYNELNQTKSKMICLYVRTNVRTWLVF